MRIVFAGTPDFAVPALDAVVAAGHQVAAALTQPDRPSGRGLAAAASPVKQAAARLGIPVLQPATLKTPEAQAEIRTLAPDALVVAAYGLILPQAVLDLPRLGAINIHASLLPRWRGAAPIHRALLAGRPGNGHLDHAHGGRARHRAGAPARGGDDPPRRHRRHAARQARRARRAARGRSARRARARNAHRHAAAGRGRDLRRQAREARGPHRLATARRGDRAAGARVQPFPRGGSAGAEHRGQDLARGRRARRGRAGRGDRDRPGGYRGRRRRRRAAARGTAARRRQASSRTRFPPRFPARRGRALRAVPQRAETFDSARAPRRPHRGEPIHSPPS